jgi:quinol monooxygenase YgiN/mannose-6-phosphate isomerase-like protein (cupin superfamily)
MHRIGRFMTVKAKPGRGEQVAEMLLQVADGLKASPGCELYVIGLAPDDPDTVTAYEVWSSQEQLDASLAAAAGSEDGPRPEDVMALLDGRPQRTDVRPLGGVGLDAAAEGYTKANLDDVEDAAAGFGFGEIGEARFPTDQIGATQTGFSHHLLRPGRRQAFGHRHERAEEVYVVLSGSGRVRIDDDVVALRPRDVLRVGPRHVRAFEAGDEGLELLAVGARHRGDGEILPGWWTE